MPCDLDYPRAVTMGVMCWHEIGRPVRVVPRKSEFCHDV